MVRASAPSSGGWRFKTRPSHTKDFKNGPCRFLAFDVQHLKGESTDNAHRLALGGGNSSWGNAPLSAVRKVVLLLWLHWYLEYPGKWMHIPQGVRVSVRCITNLKLVLKKKIKMQITETAFDTSDTSAQMSFHHSNQRWVCNEGLGMMLFQKNYSDAIYIIQGFDMKNKRC